MVGVVFEILRRREMDLGQLSLDTREIVRRGGREVRKRGSSRQRIWQLVEWSGDKLSLWPDIHLPCKRRMSIIISKGGLQYCKVAVPL